MASFERSDDGRLEPSAALSRTFAKTGRRAWNTHLLWSLMPKCEGARYIYIVRNGDDAVVSFWHHLRNQRGDAGQFDGSLDDFSRRLVNSELPYGPWAVHVADWARALDDPRVLVLRYDKMRADLDGAVREIAAHLDVPFSADCVRHCSFDAMRASESRYEPRSVQWAPGFRFLRHGTSGDGDSALSDDAKRLLREDFHARCDSLPAATKARLLERLSLGDSLEPSDIEQPLLRPRADVVMREIA
ncbi:hypothetical protein CTAYLR_004827 [Chrysophaeum taylorii]|uniref:Sulfotransferase domain-containing protein n=1 Tax=Chrysophaeum taylorii TaxID=2483200 RepID=A0AAD7UMU2_9STRA|nr:hypothetical protein CTAYLR_004827 [Chrysophaeum taylorii]